MSAPLLKRVCPVTFSSNVLIQSMLPACVNMLVDMFRKVDMSVFVFISMQLLFLQLGVSLFSSHFCYFFFNPKHEYTS